jgi:hypothetical protein
MMDFPEIEKKSDKTEMTPIFFPDMIRTFDTGKTRLQTGGSPTEESYKPIWSTLSPEMVPMPGTPDFCEFRMDGAV